MLSPKFLGLFAVLPLDQIDKVLVGVVRRRDGYPDELTARLARLPGNTDPEQAALISRWVGEAAAQFSNAPIQAFVPILVEHIVRGRLYNTRADRDACDPRINWRDVRVSVRGKCLLSWDDWSYHTTI